MRERESSRLGGLAGIAAIARPLLARRRRLEGGRRLVTAGTRLRVACGLVPPAPTSGPPRRRALLGKRRRGRATVAGCLTRPAPGPPFWPGLVKVDITPGRPQAGLRPVRWDGSGRRARTRTTVTVARAGRRPPPRPLTVNGGPGGGSRAPSCPRVTMIAARPCDGWRPSQDRNLKGQGPATGELDFKFNLRSPGWLCAH